MKFKDISIVILLYQTPHKLISNLKNYKKFKIYILDQSNDKKLKKKIFKLLPNIEYYGLAKKNSGFAKGINFLVKKLETKYFLCTQPDTFINEKSIIELKYTLLKKKDAIITVPKIKNYKNYYNKKNKKVFQVNNILGAIFLADRKKFIKIKMFDERFFFYWEDVDLCKKVSLTNFKIYINSSIIARHKGLSSVRPNLNNFIIRKVNFKYGEYLFQYKYGELKFIKALREPLKFLLLGLFYLFSLKFKKSLENFCFLFAIIKFYFKK